MKKALPKLIHKSAKTSPQNSPIKSRWPVLSVAIVAVVIIVLVTHWPALFTKALCFDDNVYLLNNNLVKNPCLQSTGRFLTEVTNPSTVPGYYQPLNMISLMIDYALGGRQDNPFVFHLTSLLLHILNTVLIIILIYLLFGEVWIAVAVGLLFGVHPMTVEPIPWIGERKTLWAAFFAFLTLVFYLLYTRKPARKYYWTSVTTYLLALLSKPTITPLPLLLMLLDIWPLKRLGWPVKKPDWGKIFEKVPFVVIGLISAAVTVISQKNTAGVVLPGEEIHLPIPLVICHNIVFYLYKMVWPVNLTPHTPVPLPFNLSNPAVLTGIIGTFVLIALLIFSLRWTKALMVGWLFFLIAIFPTMGVIGFTNVLTSDKYAYFPVFGILLVLAWLLNKLGAKTKLLKIDNLRKTGIITLILVVSLTEIVLTRNYLSYWQTPITLYTYMLRFDPDDVNLHNNFGAFLYFQGYLKEAAIQYREAIRLNPNRANNYNNLGSVLLDNGQYEAAGNNFKKAIELNPNFFEAYYDYGNLLYALQKYDEAIPYYQKTLALNPYYGRAYNNLGRIMAYQGKMDQAIVMFSKALELNPSEIEAYQLLGRALTEAGKTNEAINVYHKALQINPNATEIRSALEVLSKTNLPSRQ